MGRPATRTARLDQEDLQLYRETWGTAVSAMRNLRLEGIVGMDTFRRAWKGQAVDPAVMAAIRQGWDSWAARMMMVVRERQKDGEYFLG